MQYLSILAYFIHYNHKIISKKKNCSFKKYSCWRSLECQRNPVFNCDCNFQKETKFSRIMEFHKMCRLILLNIFALQVSIFDYVDATGSITYETNNGFPLNLLSDIVNSDVVKKKLNSRWRWEVWDVVPGTHSYQLYVFNITNPAEVEKGGKPVMQELGPYYYKEYRYKFDVSINLDLNVNFERNFTYTFDPSKSKGSENDLINIINAPLIIFSTLAAKYSASEANNAVSALVAGGESIVRKNVKVGDFLFHGMDVKNYQKYINLMGPSSLLTQEFKDGLYSVLKLKNGVHEGQFTVSSGFKDENTVGDIVTYNGKPNLVYWRADTCNEIQGSDGSVFHPRIKNSDELHMLEVDLCRSISFNYLQDVQFKSVTGNLFYIGKDVLEDPKVNTANQCFCNDDNSCLKKGVLDVSTCQFGAPIIMSYAHFYDADSEYQQGVSGMNPDEKLHRTEVTVEPATGAVITFHKRYQWNIMLRPIAGIDYFKALRPTIIPLLWNDDVFTLDPDKEELLMEELARLNGGMGSGSSCNLNNKIDVLTLSIIIIIALFVLDRH